MNSQFIPAINVSDVQHPRLEEAYTYLRDHARDPTPVSLAKKW